MQIAIASRAIYACRDTLAAGLAMRRAGVIRDDDGLSGDLPSGVSVKVLTGHPHVVARLDPRDMPLLHDEALDLAWQDGAWDVQFLRHPPLSPGQLGNISASHVYDDPALLDTLLAAGGAGRLVTWSWRPMRFAPLTRSMGHHHRDPTLDPDGGRRAPRPAMRAINWAGQGGCEAVIRMRAAGSSPTATTPRRGPDARATRRQRGYIVDLRRRAGLSGLPLPAALTRIEASAIIDGLLGNGSAQ